MEFACRRTSLLAPRISACASRDGVCLREHGLVALLSHALAGRIAPGCHAPLCQVAFLRGVRLRLGMGRCLSPSWTFVLSQTARCNPIFARHPAPSACARRRDPATPRSCRPAPLARSLVPTCAVPPPSRRTPPAGPRHLPPPPRPVPSPN